MVAEIAMQWTKVLKTGSVEAKFMAVDLNTLMFTMDRGQDLNEVRFNYSILELRLLNYSPICLNNSFNTQFWFLGSNSKGLAPFPVMYIVKVEQFWTILILSLKFDLKF